MGSMTMILLSLALNCLNYIPVCKNFTGKLIPHYMWTFSYNVNDVIEQQHATFVHKMGLRERLPHIHNTDIFRCHQSLNVNAFKQKKHLLPTLHSPFSHISQQLLQSAVDTNDITEDSGLVNETLQWTQVGAITVQSTSITSVISSLLIFLLCLSQNFEIHTANQFIRINQQNAQCSSLGIYIALSVPTCFNPQGIILRELFKFPSNYFFIISVRIQKTPI